MNVVTATSIYPSNNETAVNFLRRNNARGTLSKKQLDPKVTPRSNMAKINKIGKIP